ncbi:excinuclease ABC subunit UvrA [Candidatus Babeliales bacterium]|nr:excinuclease ABC subunit UvrA [Candidatus Babeliales bacterium]MBP9843967.1 excinuclease ABC subunit UvrA [Candidatus Babeliales bacterium]
MQDIITIIGAREHNLKNVTVSFPKNKLVVITGPSGSGKSSLALDILYVEGKRRYMESLSAYARQFLGIPKKPDFDRIDGLCPAIAIEQKTVGHNPRSTVGTITEIYDYFRVLFARIGVPHCPSCNAVIDAQSPVKIADAIMEKFQGKLVTITAPVAVERKGEFIHELGQWFSQGYYRCVIDGKSYKFKHQDEIAQLKLKKTYKHNIDIVLDSFTVEDTDSLARLQEAISRSFALADETCKILVENEPFLYSSKQMCLRCNIACPELEPRFFSFNSPVGACSKCHGLGIYNKYDQSHAVMDGYALYMGTHVSTCDQCAGMRLNKHALAVKIDHKNIYQLCDLSIDHLLLFFKNISLDEAQTEISTDLRKEIVSRLQFLANVGLNYLSLNRTARTLSGGEGQRIRLAKQVGSALSGVLYILDEPSIGLHQRDNDRLIVTLQSLKDLGNTVVVVEHDVDTMKIADYLIDMGPAAGIHGGQVTAVGTAQELENNPNSLTGKYLSGALSIPTPQQRRKATKWLTLAHARANNLKDVTVKFPLNMMCGISGVSGSGKSSLIFQELVPSLEREMSRKHGHDSDSSDLKGVEYIKNLVQIDQSPIGKTSRSNPGTYIGIFDEIRKLFAAVPESKARGYEVGQFSFNCAQGRCYECSGDGSISVSMHFLPDVVMVCKVCKGKRYSQETLQILYKDKTIADILDMTALEAVEFFAAHKSLSKKLQLLCDVGLDYVKIGQASTTLSGGEAQRIKLVNELTKRDSDTLYILDEPTTGLHSHDIVKLLGVLDRLIAKGNSIIVIEHNLDVLKTVDYLIDLGPDGGDKGGMIVAAGTPEQVALERSSYTGFYLKKIL